jgi:hypothetical protein
MGLLDKAVDKLTIDAVAEFAEDMLADARAGRSNSGRQPRLGFYWRDARRRLCFGPDNGVA